MSLNDELDEIVKKQDALRTKWFSRTNGMRKRTQTEYNRMEQLQERANILRGEIKSCAALAHQP